ncbi:hypothetical protein BDV12DRAFT_189542 [Aspergillus spectabilis]
MTPKLPCTACRSDAQKPKCGRCEKRNLECVPVERKAVFRRGTKDDRADCFAGDQIWVNSEPRKWTLQGQEKEQGNQIENTNITCTAPVVSRMAGGEGPVRDATQSSSATLLPTVQTSSSPPVEYPHSISSLDALVSPEVKVRQQSPAAAGGIDASHASPYEVSHISPPVISRARDPDLKPLANVEESCLLRYFIEELSPWFDHCDDRSHFRLVVPLRAQHCLTVRNAIFAVSSRHLSRVPDYKSPQGIIYHGQLLPDLSISSAVEYMLKCIPGLLSFPTVHDPQEQENLMAAAIILRQYEEMEEEVEGSGQDARVQGVNFLAITQTIIYSMISSSQGRSSLATAAYWIAIRQEVYYALTRRRVLGVEFTTEDWNHANPANMMIMHAGEVTKWCWGSKSSDEYDRLKLRQQQLISDCSAHFMPILQKAADKGKGEIFPTVWYSTDSQVTGVQHLELARMILIAENPRLREVSTPRAAHRKAEAQVRAIVLNLCGIAVNNFSRRMPALVNAVISIMLYGEYFTEQQERDALMDIIARMRNMHAWPLRKPFERLQGQWELIDSVDV